MALSLLSHNSIDIQTIFDPLRISLDCTFSDQMEFPALAAVNTNNIQNSENQRNYQEVNENQTSNSRNNFNDYDQVISFVDSPPNSKESWPGDYPKIVDVQTIYTTNSDRKRRMDWETLDINQGATGSSPSDAKVPNLGIKDREKKKLQGRENWTDEIDFDLNGEFSSNGYLNNEAFLSLSSALTVLKQEIPSPNSDAQKNCKSPREIPSKIVLNDNQEKKQKSDNNTARGENINNNTTVIGGGVQQQIQVQDESNRANIHSTLDHSNVSSPGTVGTFQPIIQHSNQTHQNGEIKNTNDTDANKNDSTVDDYKFQYVLAAATSIATKNNEETLTYLNQGQSYEIKLKKIGDLSFYRGKVLKSIIKICFHERRLQYMEREQMQQWQSSRPGERIIEVDVPLSYGLCHVSQSLNPNLLNTVEVLWDPMKEVGVYIKVNCISTEFTPKKHGGEKGVPFRIQVETYFENNENLNKLIHAAACQIKVFKLKGADRKHKQDREKIQRRPASEQEKYQPSYECTILNDISSDSILPQPCYSPEYIKSTVSPLMPNSPVHIPKYDAIMQFSNNSSPVAITTIAPASVSNTNNFKQQMDQNLVSPQQPELEEYQSAAITKESTTVQVAQWLTFHRLSSYVGTFTHFSGSDVLRMSKEDLIQICGLADGIRMFNTLHAKAITPRLTIYVSLDGNSYNAVYLISNTTKELTQKLLKLPGFYEFYTNNSANVNGVDGNSFSGWGLNSKYSGSGTNLYDAAKLSVYINGPNAIQVLVTDEVLNNIKDDSLFTIEFQSNGKILMKAIYKNESN